jgi:multiple sugar transport system substrate-binding protein
MSEQAMKPISRRTFLKLAGSSAALAAVVAACGPSATTAPTTAPASAPTTAPAVITKPFAGKTLNIFTGNHHDTNVRDIWLPIFTDKTGAKVNYTSIAGGDADAKWGVFLASQDTSVDVMYTWETFNAKYGKGLFVDVTDTFKKPLLDGLTPASKKAVTFQGRMYGIPFDSNMAIFMWNTDLYKAAGLDPNKPPTSWDEFAAYSKKLTANGNYGTLFTLGDPNSSFFTFITIYNSSGGTLISDDLKKLSVDTPEGLAAMNAFYDGVVTSKFIDPAGLSIASSIEQGKVYRGGKIGHYFAFPNHYPLAEDPTQSQVVGKSKVGIIPGLKLRSGSANGIEGYAINKFSPNKDLGMAWLEFTVGADIQKLVATKWGRPPALAASFADPEVKSSTPQFAPIAEQVTYPAPRYGSPFYFDLGTVFNDNMNKMLKGGMTPKEAVTKIQTDGQKVIDDYWAKVK